MDPVGRRFGEEGSSGSGDSDPDDPYEGIAKLFEEGEDPPQDEGLQRRFCQII